MVLGIGPNTSRCSRHGQLAIKAALSCPESERREVDIFTGKVKGNSSRARVTFKMPAPAGYGDKNSADWKISVHATNGKVTHVGIDNARTGFGNIFEGTFSTHSSSGEPSARQSRAARPTATLVGHLTRRDSLSSNSAQSQSSSASTRSASSTDVVAPSSGHVVSASMHSPEIVAMREARGSDLEKAFDDVVFTRDAAGRRTLVNRTALHGAAVALLGIPGGLQTLERLTKKFFDDFYPDPDDEDAQEALENYYDEKLAGLKCVIQAFSEGPEPGYAIASLKNICKHVSQEDDEVKERAIEYISSTLKQLLARLDAIPQKKSDHSDIKLIVEEKLAGIEDGNIDDETLQVDIDFLRLAKFCDEEMKQRVAKVLINFASSIKFDDETVRFPAYQTLLYMGGDQADAFLRDFPVQSEWGNYSRLALGPQANLSALRTSLLNKYDPMYETRTVLASYLSRAGSARDAAGRLLDLLTFPTSQAPQTQLQALALESLYAWGRNSPLSPEQSVELAKMLRENPARYRQAMEHLFRQFEFNLGAPVTTWGSVCLKLIYGLAPDVLRTKTPMMQDLRGLLAKAEAQADPEVQPVVKPQFFEDLAKDGWKPVRSLGRTLLFAMDGETGKASHIAVKIQKAGGNQNEGEKIGELAKEHAMARFLMKNKESLGLRGSYPTPIGLFNIPSGAVKSLELATEAGVSDMGDKIHASPDHSATAYVYQCAADNFTYLHQAESPEAFGEAAWKGLHDVFVLSDKGGVIFHQLADIFHCRVGDRAGRDGGRYQALSSFFYDSNGSCGAVDDWTHAVEYENLRMSGPADMGDCQPVDQIMNPDGDFMQSYQQRMLDPTTMYAQLFDVRSDNTRNILLGNFIGEYLMAVELSAGRFARDRSEGLEPEAATQLWTATAGQMKNLYCKFIAHCTGEPEAKIGAFLEHAINWGQYARQMQFWMSKDNAHIPVILDMKKKDIQPSAALYGDGIWKDHARILAPGEPHENTGRFDFYPENFETDGFSANPELGPDLGPDNGVDPLSEVQKARYIVTTQALLGQKAAAA
ncbi:hypothetical protein EGT07_08490 [Herbaspirillum sp. HC18]|nr:hypothetical protein EGT07_08490 [Herbaspirillum sp. HC18]